MTKRITDKIGLLIGSALLLLICAAVLFPIKAKAVETDPTKIPKMPANYNLINYTFGGVKSDKLVGDSAVCYFNYTEESRHYLVTVQTYNSEISEIYFSNPSLDYYVTKSYFKRSYDKSKKIYTYTCSIDFDGPVGLILVNRTNSEVKYNAVVTCEKKITLSKTAITEITNTKSHTMTVKYKPVKKRLGYQIEYATDSKFKNKTRVNTGATTKDIGKLTIGKIYYVRVRAYDRYLDGSLVYSKWSPTQKIKIKK